MLEEIWLPVDSFTGYEVSSHGRVRTYRPKNGIGDLIKIPRLLNPRSMKDKLYLRVTLTNRSGKQVDKKVHLLVLETFKGLRPTVDHDGCHNDGDARNNMLSNLRWGTKKENRHDSILHGTQPKGETCGLSVLTEAQVAEIKAEIPNWRKGMGNHFAQKFGVSASTVSGIKNNQTWKHV